MSMVKKAILGAVASGLLLGSTVSYAEPVRSSAATIGVVSDQRSKVCRRDEQDSDNRKRRCGAFWIGDGNLLISFLAALAAGGGAYLITRNNDKNVSPGG